eukprot:758057-Hanusia_phi.AAC.4
MEQETPPPTLVAEHQKPSKPNNFAEVTCAMIFGKDESAQKTSPRYCLQGVKRKTTSKTSAATGVEQSHFSSPAIHRAPRKVTDYQSDHVEARPSFLHRLSSSKPISKNRSCVHPSFRHNQLHRDRKSLNSLFSDHTRDSTLQRLCDRLQMFAPHATSMRVRIQ